MRQVKAQGCPSIDSFAGSVARALFVSGEITMPVSKGGKFRTVETSKGPVRLHFTKSGAVDEAKNLRSGATHSPAEFKADRKGKGK